MKVALLYNQFFDNDGERLVVGGIETYLSHLASLITSQGDEPIILQFAAKPFHRQVGGTCVVGIKPISDEPKKRRQELFYEAHAHIDLGRDILIFGADHCSVKTASKRCISIQHGVSWDLPMRCCTPRAFYQHGIMARLKKEKIKYDAIKDFENCRQCVCVDYNFFNWYRAHNITSESRKCWVVPNFAAIATPEQISTRRASVSRPLAILFARRFVDYRGTTLITKVAARLMERHPSLEFTFAGEGPELNKLADAFQGQSRVHFTLYTQEQALEVHLRHDIAVVPSLGSEGTSLAVAEAMGAECAVVATAVGGITNMVIDGFNGALAMPSAEAVFDALESVVQNKQLRLRLAHNGYKTVEQAFSVDRWRKAWRAIIGEVANG